MCERKKTGVHGTLETIPLACKLNSKQLLCKTLNSRMNIIETRAVLNIVKKSRKMFSWANIKMAAAFKLFILEKKVYFSKVFQNLFLKVFKKVKCMCFLLKNCLKMDARPQSILPVTSAVVAVLLSHITTYSNMLSISYQ